VICLSFINKSYGQWSNVNIIRGGDIYEVMDFDSSIFAYAYLGSCYVSNDSGQTWDVTSDFYDVLCIDIHQDVVYLGTGGNGIARSFDKGQTWELINAGIPYSYFYEPIIDIAADSLYQYAIGYDNSYTLYRRSLASYVWSAVYSSTQAVPSVMANDSVVILVRGNSILKSTDNGISWATNTTPYFIQSTFMHNDTLWIGTNISGLYYSIDYGATLVRSDNGIDSADVSGTMPKITSIGQSNGLMYINAIFSDDSLRSPLYCSFDNGNSWSSIPFYNSKNITGLSKMDSLLSVGSRFSSMWFSADTGKTWSCKMLNGSDSRMQGFDVADSCIFLATQNSGFAVSNDYGSTWETRNYGLPLAYLKDVSEDNGQICITTDIGDVFCSQDTGRSWTQMGGSSLNPANRIMVHNGMVYISGDGSFRRGSIQSGYMSGVAGAGYVSGMYAKDSVVCLGVSNGMLISLNNGASFTSYTLPSSISGYLTDFSITDSIMYAYVTGSYYSKIIMSYDFGINWQVMIDLIPSYGEYFDFYSIIEEDSGQLIYNSPAINNNYSFLNYYNYSESQSFIDYGFQTFCAYCPPQRIEITDSIVYVLYSFEYLAKTNHSNMKLDTVSGLVYSDVDLSGTCTSGDPRFENVSVYQNQSGEITCTDTTVYY